MAAVWLDCCAWLLFEPEAGVSKSLFRKGRRARGLWNVVLEPGQWAESLSSPETIVGGGLPF